MSGDYGQTPRRALAAHATDLRGAISIGLQEALSALERALGDLAEAQFQSFPMVGEENIALIAMRVLQDLDERAVVCQGGEPSFEHLERWLPGVAAEALGRPSLGRLPTRDEVLQHLATVRTNAERLLGAATAESLQLPCTRADLWPGTAAGAYMSAIYHAIRQIERIWLLRGLLRATGKSTVEAEQEAASPGPDAPRAVAELHYQALVDGNEPLWRTTLVARHRSPRRVNGSMPRVWWEAGRRRVTEGDVRYRFVRAEPAADGGARLLFEPVGPDGRRRGEPVRIHLSLSDEGWRVDDAAY